MCHWLPVQTVWNSHIPETVEPAVLLLIVPLNSADLVEGVNGGQSVDDMRAQEGIDVVRGEFGTAGPVLGPVGHVAHQFTGWGWGKTTRYQQWDMKYWNFDHISVKKNSWCPFQNWCLPICRMSRTPRAEKTKKTTGKDEKWVFGIIYMGCIEQIHTGPTKEEFRMNRDLVCKTTTSYNLNCWKKMYLPGNFKQYTMNMSIYISDKWDLMNWLSDKYLPVRSLAIVLSIHPICCSSLIDQKTFTWW